MAHKVTTSGTISHGQSACSYPSHNDNRHSLERAHVSIHPLVPIPITRWLTGTWAAQAGARLDDCVPVQVQYGRPNR